ncbi:hypothetical protein DH2020_007250 [Rehmannia glutinosa]|uniref:Uncharacterized protein n=1 Tax=Rehmannia glutinosa TaxID=99300 RepID=A0ABR0TXI6_REHGL
MVPQGPPAPHGGGQPVPPALLRSNSAMLGGQGGGMPSQNVFSSLVSPRNQFNNMNMLGNVPNVSSLLHQPFGNGASNSGPASSQRGLIDGGAEADPLSNVGTRMGFNHPSSSYMSSPVTANPNSSGQQQQFSNTSGNQMMPHQQQAQQLDPQNFQHNQQQFSVPSNTQQSQQQFQAMRGGLGGVGPVKVEPQGTNEQAPQQLQGLRNLGPDNNIEFWRKFVAEFFAPNAKKKWCVSMYGSGRQTTGVFPQNSSGQIVLDYAKAIQESVFEQLRVVRDGQLRIVFSPDLKICSWEFCARRHEELIPRRLLIPQVSQVGAAAQKCQAATQNASSKSLIKFPQRANPSPRFQNQSQQGEGQLQQQQQTMGQNSNNDNPAQAAASKGTPNANNTTNSVPTTSSNNTIVGLLHQNSMNSRQQNAISSANSPMPQTQPSPARFQSPTPSSSNNPQPNSLSPNISMQQPSISGDAEANDSQSSVQKIIHDMMMSSQIGGNVMMGMGTMNTGVKNVNGVLSANNNNAGMNDSNILVGNGLGQSAMVKGIRAALGNNNNSMSMNGRVGMAMGREQSMSQQDLGNQLLSGLGAVNGFNDLQFDWKGSP